MRFVKKIVLVALICTFLVTNIQAETMVIELKEVSQVLDGRFLTRIEVANDYAYTVDLSWGSLHIVDIRDPSKPIEQGSFWLGTYPDRPWDIIVHDEKPVVIIANGRRGITLVDVLNPASITHEGNIRDGGFVNDMELLGDLLYVADWDHGLEIIDISIPSIPAEEAQFPQYTNASHMYANENRLYLFYSLGLEIIDISDQYNPISIGTIKNSSFNSGEHADLIHEAFANVNAIFNWQSFGNFEVKDNVLYLPSWDNGLLIFDISDPSNLVLLNQYSSGGKTNDIQIIDNVAYLTEWDGGIKVIDISDPENPVELSEYFDGGSTVEGLYVGFAHDLIVYENHVYVTEMQYGLEILKISGGSENDDSKLYGFDVWMSIMGFILIVKIKSKRFREI
ncbi:MAG: LVIVD repeat-containing protein [Candidatus Kariarchaeaceae archaeon]